MCHDHQSVNIDASLNGESYVWTYDAYRKYITTLYIITHEYMNSVLKLEVYSSSSSPMSHYEYFSFCRYHTYSTPNIPVPW